MSENENGNENENKIMIEDLRRRVNTYSNINSNSNFETNIIFDNTKLMEDMIKKYDENTKNKVALGEEYHDTAERIINLKNDINRRSAYLRELTFKEGALKQNIKKNIYDKNRNTDKQNIYKIVFRIHFVILIVMLIGLLNVVNSMIIIIVIFVLYILVCGLIIYKYNFDKNRNKFKYKEFDVNFEQGKVCSFNPSDPNSRKNEEKEEKIAETEELKKFTT